MWEFSLNLKNENKQIASKLTKILSEYISMLDGFITTDEIAGYQRILIAVDEKNESHIKNVLSNCIIDTICDDLKLAYLDKYLFLPIQNKLGLYAFKKALINFDKETDRYLVMKNLKLGKNIFLESFFYFKMKTLK